MSVRVREVLMGQLDLLRHEPVDQRVRATLGGHPVVDSTRALLVWEPRRIVPSYAVPAGDVDATLEPRPAAGGTTAERADDPLADAPRLGARQVLDPSVPFAIHTAPGHQLVVRAANGATAQAFRTDDPDLAEHVLLDFAGFDAWFDEDEQVVSHPRDPFHRVDTRRSSRHVRVEVAGVRLAESSTPVLLFEPPLPVRFYLDPADVDTDLLRPSSTQSSCAYKGRADYWSLDGHSDIAWSYAEPLRDAADVAGRIAFFNERVDLVVDGRPLDRPVTPWSRRG
jgi:uncharacterized protein (DUF427 family)